MVIKKSGYLRGDLSVGARKSRNPDSERPCTAVFRLGGRPMSLHSDWVAVLVSPVFGETGEDFRLRGSN